jgi:hypothetical protein
MVLKRDSLKKSLGCILGANDGARTHDIRDHNPTLCQLSYVRREQVLLYQIITRFNR